MTVYSPTRTHVHSSSVHYFLKTTN
uniref:Uncharacterized protein n=1 Tax=Anguilla anguilla TaxID=7936 RepID=A0A0E9VT16_ANGAN